MVTATTASTVATGAVSGLIGDFCVATGGVGAFIAATVISGLGDATNNILNAVFNGNEIDIVDVIIDFTLGAAFGAFDYGLSGGSLKKSSRNAVEYLKTEFKSKTSLPVKKIHNKVVAPTVRKTAKHIAKNIASDITVPIIYAGGSAVAKLRLEYWGAIF